MLVKLKLILLGKLCLGLVGGGLSFFYNVYAQAPAAAPVSYDTSSIQLEFNYTFAELAKSLNKVFQDVIYVDDSFVNNAQDNVTATATKKGDIQVTPVEGGESILVTLPLHIEANYKFDEVIEGKILWWQPKLELKEHHPIQFNVLVKFTITPFINAQLKLQTQTKVEFVWITYPYVSFYYVFRFRVTEQVRDKFQRILERYTLKNIDNFVLEQVNIKKIIKQFQRNILSQPILLSSTNNLWGVVDAADIAVTPLEIREKSMQLRVLILAKLDMIWSTSGAERLRAEYPTIQYYPPHINKKISREGFVYAPVRVSAQSLQKILSQRLAEKPLTITQNKNELRMREIYFKAMSTSFIVDAYLETTNRNRVFELIATVSAQPTYSEETQAITLSHVDYKLKSASFILSLWSSVNKNRLRQAIIDNVRIPVSQLTQEIKTIVERNFDKIPFYSYGYVTVDLSKILISDVFMEDSYLVVLIGFNGKAEVTLVNLF